MNFLSINKIICVGGNRFNEDGPLTKLIECCQELDIEVVVFTDEERSSYENKFNKNLLKELSDLKVDCFTVDDLSLEDLQKQVTGETILFSINCKWIISSTIINFFKGKIFNYHAASLPSQRGAACHSWRLMQNIHYSDISIHEVSEKLDKGRVLHSKMLNYPVNENCLSFSYEFLSKFEKAFFMDFLTGKHSIESSKNIKSFYWPKLKTEINGYIDWSWSLNEIISFCKSFDDPFSGAMSFIKNSKVYLKKVVADDIDQKFHPFQYGLIYRIEDDSVWIACKDGGLKVDDFSLGNGLKVREGLRLHTPPDILHKARMNVL